jgi:hypothetical protein
MKIRRATHNNRKKAFDVTTYSGRIYQFPYAKLDPKPSPTNGIRKVYVDKELGNEAFTYVLESGEEGTVHIDHVLEYNEDPAFLQDLLVYKLTIEAQKRVERTALSVREICRRLGTSAAQLYRLLDQTNSRKSINQLISLLHILDCDVDLVVKERPSEGLGA